MALMAEHAEQLHAEQLHAGQPAAAEAELAEGDLEMQPLVAGSAHSAGSSAWYKDPQVLPSLRSSHCFKLLLAGD